MSKNTNLSFLTDYITADITNTRIGIHNTSPSYSLDLIGNMRVSGSVYLATTSGSVGIGTTTPSEKLVVYGISSTRPRLIIGPITTSTALYSTYNSQDNPSIEVNTSTTDGFAGLTLSNSNNTSGNTLGVISFAAAGTSNGEKRGAAIGSSLEASATSSVSGNLSFYTSTASSLTERMKITSTGRVLISGDVWGTERFGVVLDSSLASSTGITAYTTNSGYNGSLIRVQAETTGGTSWYGYELRASGGILKYGIYGNGTVTAPSDERRKKNIETTRDGYLQDVCNLRVVKYNWNEDAEGKDKELGFVAQEVEQIFPKLVETGYDGMNNENEVKLLKQGVLIPILVKAIQELKAELELLKQQ